MPDTNLFSIDQGAGTLHRGSERFNPWTLTWEAAPQAGSQAPAVSAREAVTWLFAERGRARRVPVGVLGPREAQDDQLAVAEELGAALAGVGLPLLCGGRNGVMEAVCRGNFQAGGLPTALLPGEDWTEANAYVAMPLATGIGPVRNALIARSCFALAAVGGGYGTLTEMAYGLHFDKPVLALCGAPEVPGALRVPSVDAAVDLLCELFLGQG